jgi:hypothetical protein
MWQDRGKGNMGLREQEKPPTFSMCTEIKNYRDIKPNIMVLKSRYKWKIIGTSNLRLA